MTRLKVKSLEWFDIMIIENNNIHRETNKDKGTFKIENDKLIIKWDKWGVETFINHGNDEYYKENYTLFNIKIETGSYIDNAEINASTKCINLKSMNKIGKYIFNDDVLEVTWSNKEKENFYMFEYGRIFSSIKKSSVYCKTKKVVKNIAIVFPQFHEIPENDEFWGKGFTEWTLLKKMPEKVSNQIIKRPHQDIGYYNLKDINHRILMEKIATAHEIHGFCYYHYWFKNKKIMYEPLELMLKEGHPDKPFMLCWANEQWTKRWDGGNNEILIEQDYDDDDGNRNHFEYLLKYFTHKNYIKVENKPIFIFYRIEEKDKKSIESIIKKWNNYAIENSFSGIQFMRFLGPFDNNIEIEGIDGFINFEPGYSTQIYGNDIISYNKNDLIFNNLKDYDEELYLTKNPDISNLIKNKVLSSGLVHYKNIPEKEKYIRTSKFQVYDGEKILDKIKEQQIEKNNQHLGLFVGWNNTPRRNYTNKIYNTYPLYYKNMDDNKFGDVYQKLLETTNNNDKNKNNMNFIFITSWNEWNEQSSLEPNNYDGYNYLNQIKNKYNEYYQFKKEKNILIISHKGGGTEKYINDLKKIYLNYNFIFFDENEDIKKYKNIDLIHINSFFSMKIANNYLSIFRNNFANIKKILTVHDYQWLYPNDPNILSYNLSKKEFNTRDSNEFLYLCNYCDTIIFPSYNILKNYNELINLKDIKNNIVVTSHNDKFIYENNLVVPKIEEYINIAFLGNFIEYKGSQLYKYLFNNLKYYNGKLLKYHVFGYLSDEEKKDKIYDNNFIYHDNYDENNIINLLYEKNIHLITHLSLFEESYCYALSNSINSGIPILYLEHGAFTERLNKLDKFVPTSVNNLILNYKKILGFILKNKDKKEINNSNNKLQPNKWYLLNY